MESGRGDARLPPEVAQKEADREAEDGEPEDKGRPQPRDDVLVLKGPAAEWCDQGVQGEEAHRENEGTGDGEEGVFGPNAAWAASE